MENQDNLPAFTLENLAWFDRCIFPDDIEKDLLALGMNKFSAYHIKCYIKERKNLVGIIELFQVFGINGGDKDILNKLVENFFFKNNLIKC